MYNILCRGKCLDNDAWVYGYYVYRRKRRGTFGQTVTELDHDNHYIVTDNGKSYEINPLTLGRYAGLTDKNNSRVFEGDIVKTKYGRLCKVFWFSSDCAQCWDLAPIEYKHPYPDKYDLWRSENLVIIGNIIDNLKLLEVTK